MRRTLPSVLALSTLLSASLAGQDPRVGLKAGWLDAGTAISNLKVVSHTAKPQGWFDAANPGSFAFANSDLAFSGNYVIQGSFNGFQVWDVSNPASPKMQSTMVCPGGQGDPSVYKHLVFLSVEMPNGRVDCGSQGVRDSVSPDRFRGVRIFDISDLDHPKQVATVQSCRGSHTHTLVKDPKDPAHVYIYISGTAGVRSPNELAGCSGAGPEDPNTSLFRIEVIKVPVASPQDARIVNSPRIFADSTGRIAGLYPGGSHGPGTQVTAGTDMCHDITVYEALGLAAGACAGNGILLDIRDPANPKRVAEVSDPNFAYWHSATFNNDGTSVLFTDEWGGGTQPRCRATDKPEWGANAIFRRDEKGKLHFASYFKLAAAQAATENCVAHNGSLIPVPGRDLFVQGWYQGGITIIDFTDPSHPFEIAHFDRGPMHPTVMQLSGQWGTYWYNGYIYGSEIGRGLDILELVPSKYLSQNEIDAARLVKFEQFNPQDQPKFTWPASFVVARAYLDQLLRNDGLRKSWVDGVSRQLAAAEKLAGAARSQALTSLADQLDRDGKSAGDSKRVAALAASVRALAKP